MEEKLDHYEIQKKSKEIVNKYKKIEQPLRDEMEKKKEEKRKINDEIGALRKKANDVKQQMFTELKKLKKDGNLDYYIRNDFGKQEFILDYVLIKVGRSSRYNFHSFKCSSRPMMLRTVHITFDMSPRYFNRKLLTCCGYRIRDELKEKYENLPKEILLEMRFEGKHQKWNNYLKQL